MQIKPDVKRLMRRELYTFLTISLVVILSTLIIQALVVGLDDEVNNTEFLYYVWSWVGGFLLIFWTLGYWLAYLWIINLSYAIETERVVVSKGIITKKKVSIPYAAITDFTLSRSLYERWLEIATIFIQTAGQGAQAGGHEGKLEGLVDFEDIHKTLRARVRNFETSASEASDSSTDSELLQSILDEVKNINQKLN
jgi:putative membrane protein